MTHLITAAILLAFAALTPAQAQTDSAATYPSRAVTIVVPFPPGGGTDVGARLVAQKLSVKWGQPVVIDNKGGAAGMLGADMVAKARPDGYTLLVGNVGTQSVNPALYKKMSYDPDTAFAPVSMIAELPLVLLINPGLPFKTVKDLITQAKAEPGKISFASSGSGGAPHLATEILQKSAGISMLHVPYKGGGPAVSDLMAGHVNMLFATVLESIGHVKSGKLRGLAVSSASRSPALPDMPTVAESGITGLSSFDTGSWIGMLAPAGTPQAIVDKISTDVREVLNQADTRQTLINQGATPLGMTPAAFKARIDADRQKYGRIIQDSSIKVE
jgi:tripartite-type tricarboxylate transporter receptor subunit TctC